MRDVDGEEWLTVTDAARAVRVRPDTIRQWASRGRIRSHVIDARTWVHLGDVRARELAWRRRVSGHARETVTP